MSTIISTITFGKFAERIQKFLANNWPDIANNVTTNEVLMYVYGAMGEVIEKDAQNKFAVSGIYPSQDGFITRYTYAASTFTFDWNTQECSLTLPFPPINLPLGVSIKSPFFIGPGIATSLPLFALEAYQRGYNNQMPRPNIGGFYNVEGDQLYINVPNVDLINSGWTLNLPMLSPRSKTGTDTDIIEMPDASLEMVFDLATQRLVNRKNRPQDNVIAGVDRYTEKP